MALADLTFKFYTDAALTVVFTGLFQLTRYTDLSDNPQDFTLYFGSPEPEDTRQLQATSSLGVDPIVLTPTDILPEWAASTAYVVGQQIQPTTPNTYMYECTTAGTSSATEPASWPTTPLGTTQTDGTVTWTLKAKKHPITEIKMSLVYATIAAATGGATLNIGTTLMSGSANAVPVYFRFTNSVTTISDDTGYPEIGIYINNVTERAVV